MSGLSRRKASRCLSLCIDTMEIIAKENARGTEVRGRLP
jgi:hypothetical protein